MSNKNLHLPSVIIELPNPHLRKREEIRRPCLTLDTGQITSTDPYTWPKSPTGQDRLSEFNSSQLSAPEFHLLLCDLSCFMPLLIILFLMYPFPPSPPFFSPSLSRVPTFGHAAPQNLLYILKLSFSSTRGRLCFFFLSWCGSHTARDLSSETAFFFFFSLWSGHQERFAPGSELPE